MIINQFLNCLSYFGLNTGMSNAIEGVYAFNSGNGTIIYNQLYPTGYHYLSGTLYSPALPLISVGPNPASNNYFSGNTVYHLGYQNTNNFEMLLDVQYSGCNKSSTYGQDYVLVSTAQSTSGLNSGFIIGINDSNRLFFQTSGLQTTLGEELGTHDFVFVSLSSNQFVTFGIYKIPYDTLFFEIVDVGTGILQTNDLYFGGFLNNNNPTYTGFQGNINQIFAFQDIINASDLQSCVNCSFATGMQTTSSPTTVQVMTITGGTYSGILQSSVSYQNVTGQVLTSNLTPISIIHPSGIITSVMTGQTLLPLYVQTGITLSGQNINFLYDVNYMNTFTNVDYFFQVPFLSGDNVEIYTYQNFNPSDNLRLNGSVWPVNTGFIQLISNGVAETLDLDYSILRNHLSGFDPSTDVLSYDLISSQPVVVLFSGLYQDLVNSGLAFDPIPNFNEEMASYQPNAIYITGVSGVCTGNQNYPSFGYDVYLNGQKLISGMQYTVSMSGVSGFVVAVSGNAMLELYTQLLYVAGSGYVLNQITDLSDSEMTFVPQYGGFQYTYLYFTGQSNYITGVNGFCEQIWINGMRQVLNEDYLRETPCMMVTGFVNPPILTNLFFENNIDLFNNLTAPTYSGITDTITPSGSYEIASVSWSGLNLNGFSAGNYAELWVNINGGGFNLLTTLPTATTSYSYQSANGNTLNFGIRYHNNNIIGNFSYTD